MKFLTKFFLLPTLFLLWGGLQVLLAQPANDLCAGAEVIGALPYTSTAYDVTLATTTGDPGVPTCQATISRSIWFTITPAVTSTYYLSICQSDAPLSTLPDCILAVYTSTGGCAGPFTSVACDDDGCTTLNFQSVINTTLTAGITYYVVAWKFDAPAPTAGAASIQLFVNAILPPANDECAGAAALTVNGTTCTTSSAGTTAAATASAGIPIGTCTGTPDDDVWYSFTATSTTHIVTLTNVAPFNTMVIQLLSGSCGSLSSVSCVSANTLATTGLSIGVTYFVRVYTSAAAVASSFTICLTTPPPPPSNDDCVGAVALTVNPSTTCTVVTPGTINSATASVGPTACTTGSSAGGTYDDDVWYSFVATNCTHIVTFQNFVGTSDMVFQVLDACNPASALLCSDPQTAAVSGLTVGITYYIRVATWTSTANQSSTFDVCITTPANMTYVSSTTTQPNIAAVAAGATNADVIRLAVTVINTGCPLVASQIRFNTTGTTNVADLNNARVYYTGTSTTFSTTTPFGSIIANPSGTLTFTGSQVLIGGAANTVNHFWLAYDVSACSPAANVIDGQSVDFTFATGPTNVPTVTDPAGSRAITNSGTSFTSVANGPWSSAATWGGCAPTAAATSITINSNVTLDVDIAYNLASLTINATRTLTVPSNTLTIGAVGGDNKVLTVSGILTLSGGTLNVNGRGSFATGSTFNMSAGNLNVDGNSGVAGTSVATGTTLLAFGASSTGITINATGGTITIVDPPFIGTGLSVGVSVSSSNVPSTSFAGNTIQFGDGSSAQAGTTSGFIFDTYPSTKNVPLGNVVVNAGSGATRFVSGTAAGGNAADIFGSLTVNSGSEIRSASSRGIGVYGNIVNNGTISIMSASSGVLFLGGAQVGTPPAAGSPQTISGAGVWRNSTTTPTASVNSLTMNNSGGATLQVPLTVGNTLTLTNGKIFTDASNYIGVGIGLLPAGTIGTGTVSPTITTNASHVVGPIRRAVTATTWTVTDQRGLFPIGDGTTARQMNIALTTAPAAGSLAGRYSATDPANPPASYADGGINIDLTSPTGFWNVEYANGAAAGGYTVQVNATGFLTRAGVAITDFPNIRLVKRTTGGNWVASADGTAAAPVSLAAVSRTLCTTFSDFGIGGTAAALPLELKSFTGKVQGNVNILNWETLTEQNVKSHLVERSVDGTRWSEVGSVASKGDSQVSVKYSLEDRAPLAKAYYRLRSVDFDGKENLSSSIVLTRKGESFGITSVYPSPTTNNVTVQFNSTSEEKVTVRVLDMTGRLVMEQYTESVQDINELPIVLTGLQAGVYSVTVSNSTGVSAPVRFVKQ